MADLSPRFALRDPHTGRPSIPPEQLLRALRLQILYAVRSERQLMEQLDYTLLIRWCVGPNMDDPIWDLTVFTRDRACQQSHVSPHTAQDTTRERHRQPDETAPGYTVSRRIRKRVEEIFAWLKMVGLNETSAPVFPQLVRGWCLAPFSLIPSP